jgi:hypothetical protein
MSTLIRRSSPQVLSTTGPLLILLLCLLSSDTGAQIRSVEIRVSADAEPRITVDAECAPSAAWSFSDSYAGLIGLGSRVVSLKAFATNGSELSVRQIAPGQFESATPAVRFSYQLNLTPPLNPMDAAKVSWVNGQGGLLMFRDILPIIYANRSARETGDNRSPALRVAFQLPPGWRAFENGAPHGATPFEAANSDTAVFAIGPNLRELTRKINDTSLTLIAAGQWSFTDSEALDLATKIYSAQRAMIGVSPSNTVMLALFPFPRPASPTIWTAETRGSTVMLLSGNLPSKVGALAQLSTPLTHEIFHLWVPNGLALDGDYDWFYEGFTVYEAARTAVRLGLLTFPEFLAAIGRAYDGYRAAPEHDRWSLIEASKRRWAGQPAVYSQSMLVAFLYDLQVRSQSRGKRSVEDIYPALFQKYGARANIPRQAVDGNEAVISVLETDPAQRDFVQKLITKAATIDLKQELAPYGLQVETFGLRTRVNVSAELTKQQRDLLRQLGYNDVTRRTR